MRNELPIDGRSAERGASSRRAAPPSERAASRRASQLTALAVFLLTAAPRARLDQLGIPVYAFDVVGVLAFLANYPYPAQPTRAGSQTAGWTLALVVTIVAAQVHHVFMTDDVMRSTYMLLRYLSGMALAVAVFKSLRRPGGPPWVIGALMAGMCTTALLALLASLPQTRGLIRPVFEISLLSPTAARSGERLGASLAGMRGTSLVGTSTLTGAFLAIGWPIAYVTLEATRDRGRWMRRVTTAAAFLIAAGAVATYSRGAVVALAAAATVFAVIGTSRQRTAAFALVVAATMGWIVLPRDSDTLLLSRYGSRFGMLAEGIRNGGEFEEESEMVRILSWTEPVEWVVSHPESLVLGYGNTRGKATMKVDDAPDFHRHAVPAAALYYFGGLGLLAFVGIVLSSLAAAIRTRPDPLEVRSQRAGIVAAFGAAGVWFVIGHAAISTARGFALTMMLVAMAHALHARGQEGPSRAGPLDSPRTNDG